MHAPCPTRIFHITVIANLPAIFASGMLLSKNGGAAAGIDYQSIAHAGAQGARSVRPVPTPPGGLIHDYVPFYFAPRSPMLFAVHGGRVAGCPWRQSDIVHFETTVQDVVGLGRLFVFYDRNATLAFSQPFTDLAHIDSAVAWDLLTEAPRLDGFCKFWKNDPGDPRYADRMERRQAEFLVKDNVPLSVMTRVGVIDAAKQADVQTLLARSGVQLSVEIMSDWYF